MPGWHARTAPHVAAGDLQVVGITEEQHPDRARLFMQWHQMSWPVMADPLNLLGVAAVPVTAFVDEHGVVRALNPNQDELDGFLAATYEPPADPAATTARASLTAGLPDEVVAGDPAAIDAFLDAVSAGGENSASDGAAAFRLGVLYRARFDAPGFRRGGDFRAAVAHWTTALAQNPNQYIWRRRLQQYGPRLDKPYPFYDWVAEARMAITARSETPAALAAEPSGAEIASPGETGDAAGESMTPHPDPDGKVTRDTGNLLIAVPVIVAHTGEAKSAYRIHLTFTPDPKQEAKWNNESGPATLWLDDGTALNLPPPRSATGTPATSSEARTVEFESATLPRSATLFFDACQGDDGVCQHLAKDVPVGTPGR